MDRTFNYTIKLKGLNCANCTSKIEERTKLLENVKDASFNFTNEVFTVNLDKNADKENVFFNIKQIVNQIEPDVKVLKIDDKDEEKQDYSELIKSIVVFIGLILNIFINHEFKVPVFIVLYLVAGYDTYMGAIKNLKTKDFFDEKFLMTIASIGAFIIGEYPEGISVMIFYNVGEFFQDLAVEKSRKSISKALKLKPDYANIEVNGEIQKVNPENVNLGDIIIVKPGEKIPLDGQIIYGSSNIDTSMISGESLPRFVEVGDEVFSGCLNTSALLKIKTSSTYENTTFAKIVDMVENASSRKSNTEKTITRFSKIYTPIVVVAAILLGGGAPLMGLLEWKDAIFRACTFLVISCPCAFVISVPLGVFAGIGSASKEGIFVKGGNYLEALADIKNLVFDKTGTLTKGVFEVTKIVGKETDEKSVLKYAYAAEVNSTHPIATAIISAYNGEKLEVDELKEIPGHGIEYLYEGSRYIVGNSKLIKKNNIEFEEANDNGVIVYVLKDKILMGYIVVEDTLKTNISKDIIELKQNGINLTLLSGDKIENVAKTAEIVGIDEYQAELLPMDKVDFIEKILETQEGKVAFVGDGVNDAPVLARADIGIAMGAIGSDLAVESSDVVLMTDEISKILKGIKISKKTNSIVKQNIAFALIVKFVVLIMGFVGLASMWAAVFADVGVTILAIFNSMRALKNK